MPTKAQTVTGTLCSVGLGKLRSPCILKTYVVTVKGFLRLLSRLQREGLKLALYNHFGSFPPGYALYIRTFLDILVNTPTPMFTFAMCLMIWLE